MKTVLVVDDYASVRFYHLSLLRNAGYETLAASHGTEALTLIQQQPVDLVMLDLVMPSMSGQEVVRRIRAIPNRAVLPVLVITSESHQAGTEQLRADAACRILAKPILPADLLREIQLLLGTH